MSSIRAFALCVAVAAALGIGQTAAWSQEPVGVNGAVNQDANGTPPGGQTRRLVIGQPVVFNERIATTAAGQTQLVFLDESAMSIGPDSDLTIDQFVYDPKSGTGKLAMSAARGLMRYVGGKLSKEDGAVTLRTRTATLTVRGGVFLLDQHRTGRLDVSFFYGDGLSVTGTNSVTQAVRRPGFSITVAGPGASPSTPYPTPTALLVRLLAGLDGRPGATGGAAQPPSEANVTNSGVGAVISGDVAASVQAAAQTQPPSGQPAAVNPANQQANLQVNTVQSQGTPGIALLAGNPSLATSGPGGTFYPVVGFLAVENGSTRVKTFGFATASLQNGILSASATNGAISFPLPPGTNNFGPQGTSAAIAGTTGSVTGTSFLAPDNAFFYAVGTSPSFPNNAGAVIGGLPTVNLPTTGVGSFSGSATGSVFNNGASYLATGGFSNLYNFGTNTGTVTISNFDGHTFSASVTAAGASVNQAIQAAATQGIAVPSNIGNLVYGGKLSGGGLSGTVGGAFFGDGASDTGGVFGVNSAAGTYIARGVFGGHR